MSKKKAVPTQESAVRRDLRTVKYRMRVVESKAKFKRHAKHKNRMEPFSKLAA